MIWGISSGLFWALDTVILGIVFASMPGADALQLSILGAAIHDALCAIYLLAYFLGLRKTREVWSVLRSKEGIGIALAACVGGPIGMSGYVLSVLNLGVAYTAVLSAIYPALGAFFAWVFLQERMSARQIISLVLALGAVGVMGYMSSETGVQSGNWLVGAIGIVVCVCGWALEAVILAWALKHEAVDNTIALQIRELVSACGYFVCVLPALGLWGLVVPFTQSFASNFMLYAALAGLVSYLCYYKAIDTIGSAKAMAANISYCAWAVLLSMVMFVQYPTPVEVVCCVVIALGTIGASVNDADLLKLLH